MSYQRLVDHFNELSHLEHAQAILGWDEAVMMPSGSGEARAQAMAALAALIHERVSGNALGEWIDTAEADSSLNEDQRLNVMEAKRLWRDATALPADLVRARQIANARCEQAWRVKRAANDWSGIVPLLSEVMARTREVAECYAQLDGSSPYDALLTRYQPGINSADVDLIFAELKMFLPSFVESVLEHQRLPLPLPGGFAIDRQKSLGARLMAVLGFDFNIGRLDVSHHPFSGGVPDDTRITTRYKQDGFLDAQMAVIHETGHALYQQGLPHAWRGQPLGVDAGNAVHESQSLLFEMQVGRSRPFLTYAAPLIQETLTGSLTHDAVWSPENLYQHATQVRPGLIRVEADEVTYPLHVIFRFDMERALLAGDLSVRDVPDAWHNAMKLHLGLGTENNFKDGCMQDVHWFAGLVGYFPCYTLGALMAAQLFSAVRAELPQIEMQLSAGHVQPLVSWLRGRVHEQGRRFALQALVERATGSPLSAMPFKTHLQGRYGASA